MMDVLNSINEQKKSNNYVDESTTGMVNIMKKFFNEQRNFNKDKDEFDIFGELISRKIRNLNTHYARATVQVFIFCALLFDALYIILSISMQLHTTLL